MREFSECQPFLVHLRAEHERLHADVCEVEQALQAHFCAATPLKVWESLSRLRAELEHHFEEEERGGCIEEAVCHCPRLSREATSVERQHPALLQRLCQLIERVDGGDSGINEQFVEDFRQFARALHAHEVAENRILKEAFGYSSEDDL